ncbi:MAG: class I SAM-dependent methyltransferase [bacterium]|nr:class I SAM-dependent methyltransferase [bacterium]
MSHYSEIQYKKKENLWFENLYFDRWFKDIRGPILDIGCATGNFIATHPEIIEGAEIDEDSLKICRERGLKVRRLDANKEMKNLPGDYYGGVYAKQIIEHLDSPLDFLIEIKRILRPGGKAVILTPNCPYALKKYFWQDPTHKHPLTREDLRGLALKAGFKEIKIEEDFRCFPGLGKLMRIFNLKPELMRQIQKIPGIKGLSLILAVKK